MKKQANFKPTHENGMKDYKKSNLTKCLIGEDDDIIRYTWELAKHPKTLDYHIDKNNTTPEELEAEIDGFMHYCYDHRIVPSTSALSLWLGISRSSLDEWKKDPACRLNEILKKTNEQFHLIVEQKALGGAMNPVLFMFLAKNHWGYRDQTEIVHKSQSTQTIDIAEQQRILRSTPGVVQDAEWTEKPISEPQRLETSSGDLQSVDLGSLLRGAKNKHHSEETWVDEDL